MGLLLLKTVLSVDTTQFSDRPNSGHASRSPTYLPSHKKADLKPDRPT